MSVVEELEKNPVYFEDDSEDNFAHYAEKASVTEGYITGKPVIALCGAIFTPSRDPEKLPICKDCLEVLQNLG